MRPIRDDDPAKLGPPGRNALDTSLLGSGRSSMPASIRSGIGPHCGPFPAPRSGPQAEARALIRSSIAVENLRATLDHDSSDEVCAAIFAIST